VRNAEHCFVIGNILSRPRTLPVLQDEAVSQPSNLSDHDDEVPTPSTVPSSAVQAIARKAAAAAAEAAAEEAKNGVVGCSYSTTTVSDIATSSTVASRGCPRRLPANAPQPSLSDIACLVTRLLRRRLSGHTQSFGHNGSNGGSGDRARDHDGASVGAESPSPFRRPCRAACRSTLSWRSVTSNAAGQ